MANYILFEEEVSKLPFSIIF